MISVKHYQDEYSRLRERITHQHSMLMRIYENARGDGDSAHAVTRWEIDTVDYQALEAFLFPDDADKTSDVLGGAEAMEAFNAARERQMEGKQ